MLIRIAMPAIALACAAFTPVAAYADLILSASLDFLDHGIYMNKNSIINIIPTAFCMRKINMHGINTMGNSKSPLCQFSEFFLVTEAITETTAQKYS